MTSDTSDLNPQLESMLRRRYGPGGYRVREGWVEVLGRGKWRRMCLTNAARVPGRPVEVGPERGRKITVYLHDGTIEVLKRLGGGNVSKGIRKAVQQVPVALE